jgi:hypothetical protein
VGDVIAGHGVTPLLQATRAAGKTANGVQMVEAVQEMMLDFMLGNRSGFTHEPGGSLTEDLGGRSLIEAIEDERYDRRSSGVLRRAR